MHACVRNISIYIRNSEHLAVVLPRSVFAQRPRTDYEGPGQPQHLRNSDWSVWLSPLRLCSFQTGNSTTTILILNQRVNGDGLFSCLDLIFLIRKASRQIIGSICHHFFMLGVHLFGLFIRKFFGWRWGFQILSKSKRTFLLKITPFLLEAKLWCYQ